MTKVEDGGVKRILVVEDELQQSRAYEKKLGGRFEVVVAGEASEALEILQKKDFDLIVLDVMLPGGANGLDLLKRIKQQARFSKVPVVVVTNLDTDLKQTALDLGAVDYVVKVNSSLDDLVKLISKYI